MRLLEVVVDALDHDAATEAEERRKELGRQAALRQQAQKREALELSNRTPRTVAAADVKKEPLRVPERIPEPCRSRDGEARTQAANLVGSNPRYIQDAKAVKAARIDGKAPPNGVVRAGPCVSRR